MAFVSPEYVETIQRKHDNKVWRLYDSSGKVLINKCDGSGSIDDSVQDLQDAIEHCHGEFVIVKLYSKVPERRSEGATAENGLQLRIRLNGFGLGSPSRNGATSSPTWMDMVAMQDRIRNAEMEKLRMELEAKEQSPWARIAERLLENDSLVTALAGIVLKAATPTAAVPPKQIGTPPSDNSNNIDETLQRLSKVDPDYQTTLSKMVSYLERNPGVINQIKPIFES